MKVSMDPKVKAYLEAIAKTALTVALGAAAGVIDNAIQNPNGGTVAYLAANPQAALVAIIVQQLAHNVLSRLEAAGVAAAIPPYITK